MGWVENLFGRTVGLDTAPLIYFIEANQVYLSAIDPFFAAVERGDIQVVTSALTLTEVLVHPRRSGNKALVLQYESALLSTENLVTMPVSLAIAWRAGELRAQSSLRTPDAIQLASALAGGADAFLTNDEAFKAIPGIQVIVLKDLLREGLA